MIPPARIKLIIEQKLLIHHSMSCDIKMTQPTLREKVFGAKNVVKTMGEQRAGPTKKVSLVTERCSRYKKISTQTVCNIFLREELPVYHRKRYIFSCRSESS